MTRWRRAAGTAVLAACAGGGSGAAVTPAPSPSVPTAVRPPGRRPVPEVVRYGPCALRYLIHRRLHIEQSFGGQQQAQDLGAHAFVSVIISGPADSSGYPAIFSVDSMVPDSGTPQPVADNMARVRALIFTGRLAPRGEFVGAAASDTMNAQSLTQLLGNFRDFLPRIPPEGLKLGAAWTDTVAVTQRGGGGAVTRRSTVHSAAPAWEEHAGVHSLRIESSATYSVVGSGQNGTQPFEVRGTGTAAARTFIAEDGRFLGGESQDSTTLTVSLPEQRLTIPVIQVLHSTVVVWP